MMDSALYSLCAINKLFIIATGLNVIFCGQIQDCSSVVDSVHQTVVIGKNENEENLEKYETENFKKSEKEFATLLRKDSSTDFLCIKSKETPGKKKIPFINMHHSSCI